MHVLASHPPAQPINPEFYSTDFGYRTHGRIRFPYGCEGYNSLFYKDREDAIYNAEKKRTFLIEIREIDKNEGDHPFVSVSYKGNLEDLPKRFGYNQDLFGYFNNNETTGSPFPRISHISVLDNEIGNTSKWDE
ncbi:MAG: hypothetical protein IPG32_17595 [Saprospirales bacterium]|nr:hypothetical protein [Saprospirales bacterium]